MFHVKHKPPHILLLNPWITDFAAYNFWIKPLGLLYLGGLLKNIGFKISLIDCLDYTIKTKYYGDGKFFKKKIDKPKALKLIPKNYSQYGITEEMLFEKLSKIQEKPNLICITSMMTYWYPGVFKLIEIIKDFFKGIPILLGGIYATLCYDHAIKNSGADFVFKGGNLRDALRIISKIIGFHSSLQEETIGKISYFFPPFDLYQGLKYVPILTSRGCPFRCSYCASNLLTDGFVRRDPLDVCKEIEHWNINYKVENIAFYDDALLIEPKKYFIPMIENIIKKGIRCNFHTPNAIHIREIDQEIANLLYRANFKTIRLGLETSIEKIQIETGGKVNNQEFLNAIKYLKKAGYQANEIGVYIMAGLPGQSVEEVRESIIFVREVGAKPIIVEYSPIPHTPLFEKAKKFSRYDIENEPLYHNNSILPCEWEEFSFSDFLNLKLKVKRGEI